MHEACAVTLGKIVVFSAKATGVEVEENNDDGGMEMFMSHRVSAKW